jgi:serine/threonine protein kinase
MITTSVPGYRFIERLGSGETCEVWLAEDESLFNRPVALKMIGACLPEHRRCPPSDALRSEIERLVGVRHPNLIQFLRWLDSPEESGLVLQHVAGRSLADRLGREGPLDWPSAGRYVVDAAEALVAAHRAGAIHGDVRPANLLWNPETDEAVLTALGVGVRMGAADGNGAAGTIPGRAPEAVSGRAGPASDVYGLAATLFTLITGEPPFSGAAIDELGPQVDRGLPEPDPRCIGIPGAMERIIRQGLAADPDSRPSLEDFALNLRGTLNQLLADSLMMRPRSGGPDATTAPQPPIDLRLIVRRQVGPNRYVPIAATLDASEAQAARDRRRVPPPPNHVRLRSGDRVRIEAVSDRHGFITVFQVDPTGQLSLLYPDELQAGGTFAMPMVRANETLQVLDVAITPTAGSERLLAVWSREPLPVRLDRLQSLVEPKSRKSPISRPYVATRDLKRVRQSVEGLPAGDWKAVSVELDHEPPETGPGDESPR